MLFRNNIQTVTNVNVIVALNKSADHQSQLDPSFHSHSTLKLLSDMHGTPQILRIFSGGRDVWTQMSQWDTDIIRDLV